MKLDSINLSKKIFSLLDLTSLNNTDDMASIAALCQKAIGSLGRVAAVCVFPKFVKQTAVFLSATPVKIATVANFPYGDHPLESVKQTIQHALSDGAHEIDVVFPYELFMSGDKIGAFRFIHDCKETCGLNILKVILETGVLKEPTVIEEVSRGVLNAGADFLKTSTGKMEIGATPEAGAVMLAVIKEMTPQLNRSIGFKVSGGIRTLEQAKLYIDLAAEVMGPDWINSDHFRIGASSFPTE